MGFVGSHYRTITNNQTKEGTMKKVYLGLIVASLCMSVTPANALFTNGGFESGNFDGWTLTGSGAGLSSVISAATPMLWGQTIDVDPYYDTYMARLQDLDGNYHSTTLSQTDTLLAADLDDFLYVRWGALLIEPENQHPLGDQPKFDIDITRNGASIGTFHADALSKQGGGWADYGDLYGTAWYKTGIFTFDLSGFNAGDTIGVSMTVVDCGWGGHGGAAFLDGIGTTVLPPIDNPIPEPTTMLLFGTGLAGLAAVGRRKAKK